MCWKSGVNEVDGEVKEGEEMLMGDEGEMGEEVIVSLIEKRRQVHVPEIEDG